MVSALWKACSEGNLENVHELLKEASSADIEDKDPTGATPLIEAIKGGHTEIVAALLDRGADPMNISNDTSPEQYTSDSVILELLEAAKHKIHSSAPVPQNIVYNHDSNIDVSKGYYGPPPAAYYYPGVPIGAPMMPDGSVPYYQHPPQIPPEHNPGGMSNLPPPEVARMIPCRYYPACRYGSACIFAHPQTPYIQSPMPPPAQYSTPYDPMAPTPYPPPTYYPMPPPSFSTSPGGVPVNHMSPPSGAHPTLPHQTLAHGRSGSDVVSPIQAPFSPIGALPPVPYSVVSPMSPTYAQPGQIPVSVPIPPLPPLQHGGGGPQSPQQSMYPSVSSAGPGSIPPYSLPRDPIAHYQQGMHPNGTVNHMTSPKSPTAHPQADGYGSPPMHRDAMTHHRRGSTRRPSFGGLGRKPPCLFFPVGKCRNGDDCRFPHIIPDGGPSFHPSSHPHLSARGGHRQRPSSHQSAHQNGTAVMEEKFSAMTVQDESHLSHTRGAPNGSTVTAGSSRSQSTDPGSRRGSQGFKSHYASNGVRPDKKSAPMKPQRVPNADEFPVLTSTTPSTTPPLRSPALHGSSAAGYTGPTAAQVLQAPAPRKDGQQTLRGTTPEQNNYSSGLKDRAELNGAAPEQPASKLPVSFAAAAAVPDAAKEVSVSA
ncbi:uncharacterized protein FIBRA_06366 [Fibroporia radiculosa]|uniref:C3H1-type domain-containing protein n=1 Tax=Fibroporia radiculosa TaxID=599839 RepID=J4GSL7_9APHY|nr:uncharacterized protein FIBRA_06366 [Fibroporia radiculosa]CCM04200.1 predicted protein [Fibroporia radiculosa]